MKSKQIFIFSEISDIEPIFNEVEDCTKLHYFKTGLLDDSNIPHYDSFLKFPNLGFVSNGDWNHIDSYLAIPCENDVKIRDIPQKSGGIKYAIDQKINNESVLIKLGGIYNENILVAGVISTICSDEYSLKLFKLISGKIKKRFSKIGSFFVGERAKIRLESGCRLVTNDKSPTEYDLKII
jgi:hypothetical protein